MRAPCFPGLGVGGRSEGPVALEVAVRWDSCARYTFCRPLAVQTFCFKDAAVNFKTVYGSRFLPIVMVCTNGDLPMFRCDLTVARITRACVGISRDAFVNSAITVGWLVSLSHLNHSSLTLKVH